VVLAVHMAQVAGVVSQGVVKVLLGQLAQSV
jgi:hypothetical protein